MAVAGAAASIWFGVFKDAHFFNRALSQEQRAAVAVAAVPPPAAEIVVRIANRENLCIQIESADLDSSRLVLLYRNVCQSEQQFVTFAWKAKAPDGTVVYSNWNFVGRTHVAPGERGEFRYDRFEADPRIKTVDVYVGR